MSDICPAPAYINTSLMKEVFLCKKHTQYIRRVADSWSCTWCNLLSSLEYDKYTIYTLTIYIKFNSCPIQEVMYDRADHISFFSHFREKVSVTYSLLMGRRQMMSRHAP